MFTGSGSLICTVAGCPSGLKGGRERMAGDVPGRSGKGQYGKREKDNGCDWRHGCQLCPIL